MGESIHDFSARLRNQFDGLDNDHQKEKITDNDYQLIRSFSVARNQEGGVTDSTVASDLSTIRTQARRCKEYRDEGLTDLSSWPEVRELVHRQTMDSDLGRGGGGVSKGSSAKYRAAIRKLLLFDDQEWAEDIDTKNYEDYSVGQGSDYLTPDERQKVLDHTRNDRDAALVALLRETGQRIGALGTLRVGDVSIQPEKKYGIIRLNPKAAGLKGAKGPRHITTSRPYVQRWTDRLKRNGHDSDDTPFFTALPGESRVEPGGQLKYGHLRRRILLAAEDAEIEDKHRFRPHNWRHAAITDMIRRGYSEQQIKFIAGWGKDSSLFEVYDENSSEEMLKSVLREEGIYEDEEGERKGPGVVECTNPRCGIKLNGSEDFCPSCGVALTPKAAEKIEEGEEKTWASKSVVAPGSEEDEALNALKDYLKSNPDAVKELIN